MTRPHTAPRRGSAALLILLALVVVGGLIAWFALASQGPGSAPVVPAVTPAGTPEGPGATRPEAPAQPADPAATTTDRTGQGRPVVRRGGDPDRFRGMGSLRGTVDSTVGLDFPMAWTLVLEPSASLAGSGNPVARRVEFAAGEQDFEIQDVPLGGYAVRAEAPGCNGRELHVLLERTSDSAYVMLQLSPAGFMEGRVNDTDGSPLEGLAVWLFPGAPRTLGLYGSDGRSTTSNVEGLWRFEDVLDGRYTLIFGSRDHPLVDPVGITFQAPSLTWPAPELPPLLDVELLVTDGFGQPVGGARLRGSAPMPFDVESAPTGYVTIRNLPHGSLSLRATHEVFGEGKLTLTLTDPDGDGEAGPYVVGLAEPL